MPTSEYMLNCISLLSFSSNCRITDELGSIKSALYLYSTPAPSDSNTDYRHFAKLWTLYVIKVPSKMPIKIPQISGQWLGHFKYGPEYGNLYGEIVTFSLVLEELTEGQFQGKCYELEGIGANNSVSFVKGYVQQNMIHFVKEYTKEYEIEEDGTLKESSLVRKPILTYDGEFDYRINSYIGQWELEANLGPTINGDLLEICTGIWEITKVNNDV